MRARRRYTDNERAAYVELLIVAGWPDKEGALSDVARRAGIPLTTLHSWATQRRNPPPSDVRTEKRFDLQKAIRAELEAVFEAMHTKRDDASYKDLTIGFGILTEKDQLLSGGATNRTELIDAANLVRGRIDSIAARLTTGADAVRVGANGNGSNGA